MLDSSPLTRRCGACGYRYESTIDACPIDRRALPPADATTADLGSYRLLERLGEGGMGAVYRAVHRKLGRAVAIKILQRDLTSDRGMINRFFHEARAANTIRHENVIEVYDFVEDGENVYFVMELLRGRDLHDTLHRSGSKSAPLAPQRAVRMLQQVAAGLHATHVRGIVHRDLKPENIFLCHRNGVDDFVKIIDFGIAKMSRPDGLSTVAGAVLGTPEYIAPEQARGIQVDGRADIYSLGCIAFEMLTLHQLFGGGTRTQVLTNQICLQPPPLRHYAPELPPSLESAVMRALAKDPEERPPTALAFAQSLVGALGEPLADPAAFQSAEERAAGRRRRTSSGLVLRAPAPQRRAFVKLMAGGALVAALFIGAVISSQRHGAPAPTPAPAAAASGVASPARPSTVAVLIESIPSGATVLAEDGTQIGMTPVSWTIAPNSERIVTFQKSGFLPMARRFRAAGDSTLAVHLDSAPTASGAPRAGSKPARRSNPSPGLDSVVGTIDPFEK
jgi:eukaryotic-like serine/threonine-protein kinase